MNNNQLAVTVEGLTRKFGKFVAVDNINLAVRRGEIFGFLGPNGAGKSTTIKMLCGILNPSAGKGEVGGLDIMTQSEEIKKNIGYMSQRFSLYDDLTVEQNLDFFLGIYNVPREKGEPRKDWALSMASLADRRGALTGILPAGVKQRLALGCAILHEPAILFLDEPTSGVDPISRRNFWDLIYAMAEAGSTVFVTTHYMEEAEYCDRLALIYRGKIIAEGTPRGLKAERMKRSVLEVYTGNPVEALEAVSRAGLEAAIFGSSLHVIVEDRAMAEPLIREVLQGAEVELSHMAVISPSLEDVFVTLIEEA
ncbi:MAG: ABC transporter ATP-binding protein [Nitrospinae bacterium]|nr:ABC transporter ATP-binding protein [Nitrospinota bacterium]